VYLPVTHAQEYLGQSIAYPRMNGVVPPWTIHAQKKKRVRCKNNWHNHVPEKHPLLFASFICVIRPTANAARIPAPLKMFFQITVPDVVRSPSSGLISAELEFHASYCAVLRAIVVFPLPVPPATCTLPLTNAGRLLMLTGIGSTAKPALLGREANQ